MVGCKSSSDEDIARAWLLQLVKGGLQCSAYSLVNWRPGECKAEGKRGVMEK